MQMVCREVGHTYRTTHPVTLSSSDPLGTGVTPYHFLQISVACPPSVRGSWTAQRPGLRDRTETERNDRSDR